MNEDDVKKFIDRTASKGGTVPMRHVSYTEYKVLKEMAKENKLDVMGFPKLEFFDEYCQKMRLARAKS